MNRQKQLSGSHDHLYSNPSLYRLRSSTTAALRRRYVQVAGLSSLFSNPFSLSARSCTTVACGRAASRRVGDPSHPKALNAGDARPLSLFSSGFRACHHNSGGGHRVRSSGDGRPLYEMMRLGVRQGAARRRHPPFLWAQRAFLVNVKLRWVKDRALDSVVSRERFLRPALQLLDLITCGPGGRVPLDELAGRHRRCGLPNRGKVATFLRRFPTLFRESEDDGSGPWLSLSDEALLVRQQELQAVANSEADLVDRLCRLLMLTGGRTLPLHTVDQLSWDMGLPLDYHRNLVPRHPEFFELVEPPGDERVWIKLVAWDPRLAVSELQKSSSVSSSSSSCSSTEARDVCLAFPVRFTRGFGLNKKCMEWLKEWQTLPYISPYADASGLDPRTDVSEKRNVGVFHELLHLTLAKKTERRNVSNLRKPLGLPQKFTKVFERHPGIFYLSQKMATQTVVLREAYGGGRELLNKHPLQDIRDKYLLLLRDRAEDVESDDHAEKSDEF